MYIDKSIRTYLDDLAAKKAAPGGGSAAGLTGALGVSLLLMAANFTIGKEKFKAYETELLDIIKKLGDLKSDCERLIDADVEAYTKLSGAFKIKKGASLDEDIKAANQVPLDIAEAALAALALAEKLSDKCNPNLISDMGAAIEFLSAACEGAKYNITINLNYMADKEYCRQISDRLGLMATEGHMLKKAVEEKVKKIMGSRK